MICKYWTSVFRIWKIFQVLKQIADQSHYVSHNMQCRYRGDDIRYFPAVCTQIRLFFPLLHVQFWLYIILCWSLVYSCRLQFTIKCYSSGLLAISFELFFRCLWCYLPFLQSPKWLCMFYKSIFWSTNQLFQKNHLSGLRKSYLKISFDTVQQLMQVKRDLTHIVERNQAKMDAEDAYESILIGKR